MDSHHKKRFQKGQHFIENENDDDLEMSPFADTSRFEFRNTKNKNKRSRREAFDDSDNSDDQEMSQFDCGIDKDDSDCRQASIGVRIEGSTKKKKGTHGWHRWLQLEYIRDHLTIAKVIEAALFLFLLIISVITFASYVYFKPFDNMLFVLSNNGSLGINTESPQAMVDINGNVSLRQNTALNSVSILSGTAILSSINITQDIYNAGNLNVEGFINANAMDVGDGAITILPSANPYYSPSSVSFSYGALFQGPVNITDDLTVGSLCSITNGNGVFTGTVSAFGFPTPSSSDIQTNVTALNTTTALNAIMNLTPVTFFYNAAVMISSGGGGSNSNNSSYGADPWVGIEAQNVANATSAYSGIVTQTTIPLNGNITPGGSTNNYTGPAVDYAALVPLMVAALQQQMQYIQQLATAMNVSLTPSS